MLNNTISQSEAQLRRPLRDREVIRKTNETSARAFPVILNVEHPQFFPQLYQLAFIDVTLKLIF